MALEIINVGTSPNDGTGDPIRTAYIKCNNNFAQIYSRAQSNPPPTLVGSVGDTAGMYAYDQTYFYWCYADYNGVSNVWATMLNYDGSVTSIVNGTSNVFAVANGNVTISSAGTSNVAVFSNTGAFFSGTISATGNVTGGNLLTGGLVSATGNIIVGNVRTGGLISATGNVTGGNLLTGGLVSATGNITSGNLLTSGTITATGNITASGYISVALGLLSTSTYNGSFSDGVVVDYTTGNARISTGSADGLNIYNNGVANTLIASFNTTGALSLGASGGANLTAGNVIVSGTVSGYSRPSAGTTSLAPILLTSGNNLTSATAGAIEYDGNTIYATNNTTSGRGEIGIYQEYRYTSAGSALGPTIADYFPSNSSINLEAGSYYEVEAMAYFLKTTANTVTWTWACSSAASMIRSYYVGTVATGFTTSIVTGTPVTGMAVQQTSTALAHAATASLTDAVYHHFHFKVHVVTNLATNLRLRVTSGSGTVTPQAGSFYFVRKIAANAGSFAA